MKQYRYVGPHDAVVVEGHGEVANGDCVTPRDEAQDAEFEAREDWEQVPDKQRSKAAQSQEG